MANGILCIHCGWQETEHKYPEYVDDVSPLASQTRKYKSSNKRYRYTFRSCPGYNDGIRHSNACPRSLECTGNCEEIIAKIGRAAAAAEFRANHTLMIVSDRDGLNQRFCLVDTGS
jgi:hypothetical protein